jgi:hypothetical protein
VLVLGKPEESLLIKAVKYEDDSIQMPPKGKLTDREIKALTEWVKMGAPDPRDKAATAKKERVIDIEKERQHWAFQPLRRSAVPVTKSAWARTPVDHFLLAQMQAKGVTPNQPAERAKLIRRASLDLLGLPPTPEEVAAFVQDSAPDAYEKMIDRLLASPHYGERWGRHWLDLARFAESHGFEHDYDRPHAYHYRDFVIKALNADMPYNQFVQWQLAGDELAPDDPLALMATGFLAAGVHSTQITKNQVEKERYDELDDKLATIGTAMLGLTFGCARCHDHKYDPIPTADYYRMLATFTTTVRSDYDINLDPGNYRQALATYEKAHEPLVQALQQYEVTEQPQALQRWLERWQQGQEQVPWVVLPPVAAVSQGGATLRLLPDDSLLVTGTNPPKEMFTIVVQTRLQGITALRLEALSDPSLPKGGPGRASNGNFALTDFRITAKPLQHPGPAVPVKLQNPRATFEQKGLPVRAALTGNPRSGWAVDPQFGKDHAAVFALAEPVGHYGGTEIRITMRFENNQQHAIGRPRISVTTLPNAPLLGPTLTERMQEVLQMYRATGHLTRVQQAELRHWYRPLDPQWQALKSKVQDHATQAPQPKLLKALICSEGVPAVRLHTQGGDFLDHTHFLNRGDPNQKRGIAPQGFLQVLMRTPAQEKHWQTAPPAGWRTSYRRLAMARWLTDTEYGAGHLLARVIVNRLWQHHFGRGIVATPSDFGTQGARPTHPELLDWLAAELIRQGWRLKPIHRLLMTSAVYMQTATVDEEKMRRDPQNQLFSRWQPRRLEAEIIRDCILCVSGTLDRTMFGPGTLNEHQRRRSIYFTVKRSKLIPMLLVFDAPDALQGLGTRAATTVAPQALLLMNHPAIRAAALNFGRRVAPKSDTPLATSLRDAFLLALSRPPTEQETAAATAFLQEQMKAHQEAGHAQPREQAWADFCQVLLSLNEFVYME